MNQYPVWKYFLVLFVLVIAVVYSAPNLYPPDHALQVSGVSGGQELSDTLVKNILDSLEEANLEVKAYEKTDDHILVRMAKKDDQLSAKQVVDKALSEDYVVALNLAPTTPEWLSSIGGDPMKLGLDLSGGIHFLLEVDTDFAITKRLDGYKAEIMSILRDERVRGYVKEEPLKLVGKFKTEELRDEALDLISGEVPDLTATPLEENNFYWIHWTIGEGLQKEIASDAVSQNLIALRNRVNELGVSEPLVQRQGLNRIVVELPGVQDSATAKRIIGKTANLEFRLEGDGKSAQEVFPFRDSSRGPSKAALLREVVITGDQVATAQSSFDENGRPQVNITLDGQGGNLMHRATKNNVGRRLGVLFIERKHRTKAMLDEEGNIVYDDKGRIVEERVPYYEKQIISLATIQSALGVQFRITGLDNPSEAKELALLLRAGALAAPIDFVEERTIGPSLGEENIELGINAVVWGMALVLIFMVVYYKLFGLVANFALVLNLVMIVSVMSILSATLTLPGIAGIVLTVGMAVDANVLIFARIKEELADGVRPQQAIASGYDRAFVTIMDANITTLIVAVILYAAGTGPVKGFAITLAIGIVTSMFTAIVGTRSIINLVYGNRPIKKLAI